MPIMKIKPSEDYSGEYFKHETAVVDAGAIISDGVKIWHFSHVCNGAFLGMNCMLGQSVHVGPGAVVGVGCRIQNNVQIFEGVVLESYVFVGPSVTFTNILTPRADLNRHLEFKQTRVKYGATIGANSTILCGITIGERAMIGAGSVVTHDVPAHALVYGNPARQHGTVCDCGEVWRDYCKPCPVCGAKHKCQE